MRILPPKAIRREVCDLLSDFYVEHERALLDRAIVLLCGFYGVKLPVIRWRKRIMNGQALGLTWEDGTIDLIHPRQWVKRRTQNTEEEFINTVLHELAHHIFWADAERKAERFAKEMMQDAA